MTSLGGLYPWAQASLGNLSGINDFSIPLAFLTVAIAQLLKLTGSYVPLRTLPAYIGADQGQPIPWGNRTVSNSNPIIDTPDTGVVRKYDWIITREIIAPDGVNKSAILINGRFPGPTIEANWGDRIQVAVHNHIVGPGEGTSLHWHGLQMKDSPWADGVPGVSQCPIAPGSSLTYDFKADLYGSSWYHSHYLAQYMAGLYGTMIIHGPVSAPYDIDLGPVLIHDWFRTDYTTLLDNTLGNNTLTALLTPADNTLMHGEDYVCTASAKECTAVPGMSKWKFTPGKIHRLRLINPSSTATPLLFSIDNHTMTVISNDFTPVIPYSTNVVTLAAGQRTDILVKADQTSGSFYLRARSPALCNFSLQVWALAALYYDGTSVDEVPVSLPHADFNAPRLTVCRNDPLNATVPAYSVPAVAKPDANLTVVMDLTRNAAGQTRYTMNGVPYQTDFNHPLLESATSNTTQYAQDLNVYNMGSARTVRVNLINDLTFAHPMHFHGHTFQVLAEGQGKWDGTITNEQNPQRRDTQIVQASGYAILQFDASSPGVWPLHCHLAWHLSAGMHVNLITQQQRLPAKQIAGRLKDTCDSWNAWSSTHQAQKPPSGV